MKKHEKEQTPESTEFDREESVGDSALAENQEGRDETKPIDEDESLGASNLNDKKKNK
ncbi:hypothetical protein [Olivibacter sp. XZL3]|uniref:hypothetical protein n=1 Tax=Olivibacter sp. XZL3 TaxID=1735116 RepID=UPI001416F5B3|nr:hypothetical protein [Olivibacter sp. XZL3]